MTEPSSSSIELLDKSDDHHHGIVDLESGSTTTITTTKLAPPPTLKLNTTSAQHHNDSAVFDSHFYPPPSTSSTNSLGLMNDQSSSSPTEPPLSTSDITPTLIKESTTNSTTAVAATATTSTTLMQGDDQPIKPNIVTTNNTPIKGRSSSVNKRPLGTSTPQKTTLTKRQGLKQYFQSKYLGFEHHLVSRSEKHRDSEYRSQLELITAIDEHCDSVLHTYSSFRMFILSLMGGIYVAIATLLTGLISSDLSSKAMQKFMTGIAFVGGFTMIIFSKSILFTEVNISVSVHLFKNDLIGIIRRGLYYLFKGLFSCFKNHLHIKIRRPHKSIKIMTLLNSLKLWSISIVGNILGTVMMASVLNACFSWYDNQSMVQYMSSLTKHKIHLFEEKGANGWFLCLLSGMVANFMIGVATLLCTAGTTIMGKILALFFPIIAFAALGVQHAPANVGYFSHIFIWDSMYSASTNLTITPEIDYVINHVEWYDGLAWNLIPSAIGNALGGFFLAFIFVFVFIK